MTDRTLVHVTDEEPGIERHGRTRFRYVRQTNRTEVRDERDLARIRSLAVPPAWTSVWICSDPAGHLQATGRDARGRKQYRYHTKFRSQRERRKFGQLYAFGHSLSGLRDRIDRDLRSPLLGRDRVLAAVVSLLDLTYIRIGNESYARENRSYGLTTMRCAHLDLNGSQLRLRFVGKNGRRFDVTCCDRRLARVVRRCRELPGQLLFQYLDGDDEPRSIGSADVNDYLQDVTALATTAKTFRTWGATLLAAEALTELEPPTSDRPGRGAVNDALVPVARTLGNTVAVCRASYVHPVVLDAFLRGTLSDAWAKGPKRAANGLTASERKLLSILPPT